jgi:predicted patatin/cPLA2 family phospholipase
VKHSSFQTALVVEGGALRGVFSTGILYGFLEAAPVQEDYLSWGHATHAEKSHY